MFTSEEIYEHILECLAPRESDLVAQRFEAKLRWLAKHERNKRTIRDPAPKPCGYRGCTSPRLRIPDKPGARLCELHENARLARLARERKRKRMRPDCLAGTCHHLTRPCMTIRRLRGQLGGASPISSDPHMPPLLAPNAPMHFASAFQPVTSGNELEVSGVDDPNVAKLSPNTQIALDAAESMAVYGAVNILTGTGDDKEADHDFSGPSDTARIADRVREHTRPDGGMDPSGHSTDLGQAQAGQAGHGEALRPTVKDII